MSDDRLWEDEPQTVFRPSYSATSLFCAGSLCPSMNAPDTAGYDAAVGTVFHEVVAEWQLIGERPDYLLGRVQNVSAGDTVYEVTIDEDMFVYGQECLDRFAHIPGDRHIETRVDISSLTPIPGQKGTCDLAICRPGILVVIDWKYGKGVKVYAKWNTQLQCYAWGFFDEYDCLYDFQTIQLWIAQPRLGHFECWEVSRGDLLAFAEFARERWALAWSGRGDRSPSPKACQWCKVRTTCVAQQALLEAIADDSFDTLDEVIVSPKAQQVLVATAPPTITLTPPVELPTERLAWIYQYRKSVESWFADIGEELTRRGLRGEDLGGLWKIGEGRLGNRRWLDEHEAIEAFKRLGVDEDDLLTRKMASPPTVEKMLRSVGIKGKLAAQFLALYTQRASGKPTLMPTEDNRRSIDEIVDESFE